MADTAIGCIGLGVMGEPICAHLLARSGCRVAGFDPRAEPLARLAGQGLERAASAEAAARDAAVVFLSLPGGPELADVGAQLLGAMRPGAVLVDLSTVPVHLTRDLAARFAARGVAYADAPVARTRFAAERGERPSFAAALVKLRSRPTARRARRSFRSPRCIYGFCS